MENTPWDRMILAKNAGCLLFMLFGSPWFNCLCPKYSGHWGLKCQVCVSRLTPYCLSVSLTLVHPLVTLCTLVCVWFYWDLIDHCGCKSVLPLWYYYCVWCQICDLGIYQWFYFLFVLNIWCSASCIPSSILSYCSGRYPSLLCCRFCCCLHFLFFIIGRFFAIFAGVGSVATLIGSGSRLGNFWPNQHIF